MTRFRSILIVSGCLLISALILTASEQEPNDPPPRDDFSPKNSQLKRLSNDEVEKETERFFKEEESEEKERDKEKESADPAANRIRRASKPLVTRSNLDPSKGNRARSSSGRGSTRPLDPSWRTDRVSPTDVADPSIRDVAPRLNALRFSRDSTRSNVADASEKSGFQITLKNAFIEKYKNRVTVESDFRVVHAGKINSAKKDGDQHIAGLAEQVGLACVAEIMNAKSRKDAVKFVNEAEESGDVFKIAGVWRLWCEHPGKKPHVQDDVIPEYKNTNPDHVFEIHPVTRVGKLDVVEETLIPIDGFDAKPAKKAFTYYESLSCFIEPDPDTQTTTIFAKQAGYNYVEFQLEVEDEEHFVTVDGRIVRCSVLDLDDHLLVKNRRMVFVHNSPPEKAVKKLGPGKRLHVLGIPRIDLAIVSWRARNAKTRPEVLTWNLPYEIIVVAHFDE